MEMTFPHHLLRQGSTGSRLGHRSILSVAAARQANSQTVRVLRQAAQLPSAEDSDDVERIHYFARYSDRKIAVRGAFWKEHGRKAICEPTIYQAASMNIKQHHLDHEATGEQLDRAGHGASRKL
jgi:hypothetical protein